MLRGEGEMKAREPEAADAKPRRRGSLRARGHRVEKTSPHLSLVRAPSRNGAERALRGEIRVATYNVHRWTGLNGRSRPDPARAAFVISEIEADLVALQEVLRPPRGPDPLVSLADALGLHVAFATTRAHRDGHIGNAILSRWPISSVSMLDLSYGRLEKRVAVVVQLAHTELQLDVVATHLALADRTRVRQVRSLLDHPRLRETPTLLMGDMNAWRNCKATRELERELVEDESFEWPSSFPSASPVWALDRIYARGVKILSIGAHASRAARRASDHLPVVARVQLPSPGGP